MCRWAPGLGPLSDYTKLLKKNDSISAWYLYIKTMAKAFKVRFSLNLIFPFLHLIRSLILQFSARIKLKPITFPRVYAYLPLERFV